MSSSDIQLSKEYAAIRRASINPDRAIDGEPTPGDPFRLTTTTGASAYAAPQPSPRQIAAFDPDEFLNLTTYLTVVDRDRNMVSLTSSLLADSAAEWSWTERGFS